MMLCAYQPTERVASMFSWEVQMVRVGPPIYTLWRGPRWYASGWVPLRAWKDFGEERRVRVACAQAEVLRTIPRHTLAEARGQILELLDAHIFHLEEDLYDE